MPAAETVTQPATSDKKAERKSYFDCFLADQPGYLVPERLMSGEIEQSGAHKLVVNPNAWFSWRDALPEAVSACYPLPDKFLQDTGLLWICDPAAGTATPFWAGPWFQSRLSGLERGRTAPALSSQARWLLLSSGLFLRPDEVSRRSAEREQNISQASRKFRDDGYVPQSGLIHPFHVGALRRYYRHLLRTGGMKLGDSGSPRRFVAHNESVARFFHRQLAGTVSAVAGVPVKPSYVYVASYQGGADLPKHTDRAQCEYSITLLLDHTPEPVDQSPWPLYLMTGKGPVAIWQGLGDGLMYRGRQLPHYRTKLAQGMTSTSIFFHYVDQSFAGPLA